MNDYNMWQVFYYENENMAKTYDDYKKEYFSHPTIEIKDWKTKLFGTKTYLVEERKIPYFLWILLKFKKTIIDEDVNCDFGDEWKTVVHGKILFNKVYIMKDELYKNGFLWLVSKLKRKDFYYKRKFWF